MPRPLARSMAPSAGFGRSRRPNREASRKRTATSPIMITGEGPLGSARGHARKSAQARQIIEEGLARFRAHPRSICSSIPSSQSRQTLDRSPTAKFAAWKYSAKADKTKSTSRRLGFRHWNVLLCSALGTSIWAYRGQRPSRWRRTGRSPLQLALWFPCGKA